MVCGSAEGASGARRRGGELLEALESVPLLDGSLERGGSLHGLISEREQLQSAAQMLDAQTRSGKMLGACVHQLLELSAEHERDAVAASSKERQRRNRARMNSLQPD